MTVRVRFLGTGNAFADGGRSHACIEVSAGGASLLLDCGGSALPMLKRLVDLSKVAGVAVSHLHGDHFGGLPYLIVEQHYAGRTAPLTIFGPRELEQRARAAADALYPDFFRKQKLTYPVPYQVFGGESEIAGMRLSGHPVLHVPESNPHGVRVLGGGKVIAYSGDAIWSDELVRLARGADLFICDATNFSTDDSAHVSYKTLVAHRRELDCGRIVLTHLGSESIAHLHEFELEPAAEGMELQV